MERKPEPESSKRIKILLDKWSKGRLTKDEKEELNEWYRNIYFRDIPELDENEFKNSLLQKVTFNDIVNRAEKKKRSAKIRALRWKISGAAAVILVFIVGAYFLSQFKSATEDHLVTKEVQSLEDLEPAQEGAILTLHNGQKIVLDEESSGIIGTEGSSKIKIDKDNNLLTYHDDDKMSEKVMYNTLSTTPGRKYKLKLPDGSIVWLNASSSITYPVSFAKEERKVSVTGEAFFEVAKITLKDGSRKPFIVDIKKEQRKDVSVKVLGTSFNINSYGDEPDTKLTLLSGSIQFATGNAERLLVPGQQASIQNEANIKINSNVDTYAAIAWKDNLFYFNHTNLETILREFSRWYNIKIVSEGNSNRTFSGKISRNLTLSEVLEIMDLSHIKYTIKDNQLFINEIKN